MSGGVQLYSDFIKLGMIQIGFAGAGILNEKRDISVIGIAKGGKLIFMGHCRINAGTNLNIGSDVVVKIGNNVVVNGKADIISQRGITIGDNSIISWNCTLLDTDFHKIIKNGKTTNISEQIKIGTNCWVGCETTFLKGAAIPDNCVVGAKSLINKKFSVKNSLICGNPAKEIQYNIEWEK